MSNAFHLFYRMVGIFVAVLPMWIYAFTNVGFEFPVIMALSTIAALVWITEADDGD